MVYVSAVTYGIKLIAAKILNGHPQKKNWLKFEDPLFHIWLILPDILRKCLLSAEPIYFDIMFWDKPYFCYNFYFYIVNENSTVSQRKKVPSQNDMRPNTDSIHTSSKVPERQVNWKRILLLIIAITVHNIPGNL